MMDFKMTKDEAMKLALKHAKQDERHMNHAETRYWCRMYRDMAEKAIEALALVNEVDQEQPAPVAEPRKQERMNNELAMREPSAIRDRLIQAGWTPPTQQPAQQEPVAWMCHPFGDAEVEYGPHQQCENCIPLYTSPPTLSLAQRTWVGLTDEDIQEVRENCGITHHAIKTIEAKLKEKNT
jgi:hypothetical protein